MNSRRRTLDKIITAMIDVMILGYTARSSQTSRMNYTARSKSTSCHEYSEPPDSEALPHASACSGAERIKLRMIHMIHKRAWVY